jgi:hypothetical protein
MNRSMMRNETEKVPKSLFKRVLTAFILKLLHQNKREGSLPNSSHEASITPIPKLYTDTKKSKLYINFLDEYRYKNS